MPYNQALEARIDQLINEMGPVTKKKMFGGVGYLIAGNMCCGIHKDSFILRTTEADAAELMRDPLAKPFDITGRAMKGWVNLDPGYFKTDDQLKAILKTGIEFAKSLPPK